MKATASFTLNLAGALFIVIASAAIAAAQTGIDTCAGLNSTIGGTCTPLANTTSGASANTVFGADALETNTTGTGNTATGYQALVGNTTGSGNTATGSDTLIGNRTGKNNTAIGSEALQGTSGSNNTAIGEFAGDTNTTGSNNIVIGESVGEQLGTGNDNIDIGWQGPVNLSNSNESDTIRIGTAGQQTATYIHGIFVSPGTKKACQVVVQSNGRLDCMASSARYKHDIRDMGSASDKLMKLRPVIFQYKDDSTGTAEYGLIAEEVEKVYPELVIDGGDGQPQTVAYQELPAMLLNEVQKERRQLAQKDAEIAAMRRQLAALQKKNSEIDAMAERLDALERQARASQADHLAVALH